jgi:hypothetical protein
MICCFVFGKLVPKSWFSQLQTCEFVKRDTLLLDRAEVY